GGHAVTVATRLPARLVAAGGWTDTVLPLPGGRWRDLLTGATHAGPRPLLTAVAQRDPGALLVPGGTGLRGGGSARRVKLPRGACSPSGRPRRGGSSSRRRAAATRWPPRPSRAGGRPRCPPPATASTTRSGLTVASRCPIRAHRGSRLAARGAAGRTTTPPSRGPTAAG